MSRSAISIAFSCRLDTGRTIDDHGRHGEPRAGLRAYPPKTVESPTRLSDRKTTSKSVVQMHKKLCKAWCILLVSLTLVGLMGPRRASAQRDDSETTKLDKPSNAAQLELFFQPDVVQTIHLEIDREDLARMRASLPKRIYVPGSFRWQAISIRNVAIRYKGNSSSNPNQQHKRSFLIRFDEFQKKQKFLGLRRVSLDNGIQFGSLFSEPIITEILRKEKVISHRCNFAKLYLNGKYYGVYGNVERIDESFIEHHLPDRNGALFKVDEGGPGCDLQFLGDDPAVYSRTFEPKTKAAKDHPARLVEFIKMINHAPKNEFAKALEANMELDSFLRVMAVMLFSGAFDQLTGWNPHNYYLYHDNIHHRWRYLPWDLDVGFCDNAFGRIQVIAEWNAAWPLAGGGPPRPILIRIVDDPELLKRYRHIASRILEQHFKPEKLNLLIDAKYQLIRRDLMQDPFPHRRVTNPDDRDYAGIVKSMKEFVNRRYETARAQLNSPGERPKFANRTPQRADQPSPGPASTDAPTNLRVVSATANAVVLKWTDNATGEVGYIVQRASGDKNEPFGNHIGLPGGDVVEVTDRNVLANRVYRYRVYAVHPTPLGRKGTRVSNVVTVQVEPNGKR